MGIFDLIILCREILVTACSLAAHCSFVLHLAWPYCAHNSQLDSGHVSKHDSAYKRSSITLVQADIDHNHVWKNIINFKEQVLTITRSAGSDQSDGSDRDINCDDPHQHLATKI